MSSLQPRVIPRLWDIHEACGDIELLCEGVTLDHLRDDRNLRHLLERKLEIIGEALRQASTLEPNVFEKITDVRGYISMRNVIAHAYSTIDPLTLLRTCQMEIPLLLAEVNSLLEQ